MSTATAHRRRGTLLVLLHAALAAGVFAATLLLHVRL